MPCALGLRLAACRQSSWAIREKRLAVMGALISKRYATLYLNSRVKVHSK